MAQQQGYDLNEEQQPLVGSNARYVGSDIPKTPGPMVADDLLNFGAPDTKGLKYLEQGGKFLAGTLQNQAERNQANLRGALETQDAVGRSIAAAADSVTQIAKAKMASGQNKAPFDTILDVVGDLVKQRKAAEDAKKKEEQLKAEQLNKQQYLQAFTDLQELKTSWREKGLDEHGTLAYQKALQELVTRYPLLNTDQMQKLVDDGYGIALQYAGEKSHKQQKTLEEIADQQRTSQIMGMQLSLNADLKELKSSVIDDPQPILDRIDQKVQKALATPGLDPLTGVMLLNASMKETLSNMDSRNETYFQLKERSETLGRYAQYVEGLNRKVEAGEMSAGERKWAIQQWKNDNNLLGSLDETNPFDSQKEYKDFLEREQQLRRLEEQGAIDSAERAKMSDNMIGYLAWGVIQNPSTKELIKSNKAFAAIPGVRAAIQLAETYMDGEKTRNGLQLKIQGIREEIAQLDKQGLEWFINKTRTKTQNPSTKAILDSLGLGMALPDNTTDALTPTQLEQMKAAYAAVRQEKLREMQLLEGQYSQSYGVLQNFGLTGSKAAIQERMKGRKGEYDAFVSTFGKTSSQTPTGRLAGSQSPFEASSKAKLNNSVNFATTNYKGKKVVLPFAHGANLHSFGNYAQDRGSHTHAGEDIAVPEGTHIVSPVRGVVKSIRWDEGGYGQYMDVLGADGMLYRYAHLQQNAFFAKVGDKVDVGSKLARSGSTGRSSGPHLHFEIRNPNNEFGFEGTVDPLAYLASKGPQKASQGVKARTLNDKSWHMTGLATPSLSSTERIPNNAIPLPGGYYILGNSLKRLNKPQVDTPVTQAYSGGNPLTNMVTKGSKVNDPNDNYGYSVLAQDHQFRKKLASVSTKLGISAQWLADIMSHESNFNQGIVNGLGCTGLIQFCPQGGLDETGLSSSQLANMSRAQQMEHVYNYLKKFGKQIQKGPEYTLAAIWGGQGLLNDIQRRGLKTVMDDPRVNDCGAGSSPGNGCVTFGQYVGLLGSGAGRNYKTAQTRAKKMGTAVHTQFKTGCPLCSQLREASSPYVPHEAP